MSYKLAFSDNEIRIGSKNTGLWISSVGYANRAFQLPFFSFLRRQTMLSDHAASVRPLSGLVPPVIRLASIFLERARSRSANLRILGKNPPLRMSAVI